MNITITGPEFGLASHCEPVLRSLPEWFGLEDAVQQYVIDIDHLPTLLARRSGKVVGFLTLKEHNPYSAEVYVTGVLPEAHRQGIGSQLLEAAEAYLRQRSMEYLQVKTLGPSNPDAGYARTRAFYTHAGFRPLEEFSQIWDANNPCLILIKRI